MKVYGYLRVSTTNQDNEKFKGQILKYANEHQLGNVYWVEEKVSGKVDWTKRNLGELINNAASGDIIIVPELSRLGRSINMIYNIIEACQKKNIEIHAVKQGFVIKANNDMATKIMINTFSLAAEIERDFISARTIEALEAKKAAGVTLGRPKGSVGKSKLDEVGYEIHALHNNGSTLSFIAKRYGVNPSTIKRWLETHPEN